MAAEPTPPPGQLLDGRYRLEERLKQGGMGEVWRARHLDLDRTFAVKLLPIGPHEDQASREHFFREARLSSSLSHPNIVSVTDFGIDEARGYFLVMELLEGASLRDRMEERPLPTRIVCDVLDQIASAVRYAHGRGVVHCDLKPENIFLVRVSGDNRRVHLAKLLDFGLSFRNDDTQPGHGGTPPYVAPERLRGFPPTARCDVYALGVIFYELIAGVRPFVGSMLEVIEQQLDGPPPQPPSARGGGEPLDSRLEALIMRALSSDPALRHPTVEAFQFELRTFMNMTAMRSRTAPIAAGAVTTQLPVQLMQSPLPIAMFEVDGTLRYANQRFLELAALRPSAVIRSFDDLSICQDQPLVAAAFARALEKRAPVLRELACSPSERRYLWLSVEERGGRVTGMHASVHVFPRKPEQTESNAGSTSASSIGLRAIVDRND
ncbi:MAG: protein kinase [Polyangia bacterium]